MSEIREMKEEIKRYIERVIKRKKLMVKKGRNNEL